MNQIQKSLGSEDSQPATTGPRFSASGVMLIALMAIGSAILWPGLPVGWIWIASQLESGANPSIGPYALVVFWPADLDVGTRQGLDRARSRLRARSPAMTPTTGRCTCRG